MERYLLLEDNIRQILTNIGKRRNFSRKSAQNYRDKLARLQRELKSHIIQTEELVNNKGIISRYKKIKENIALSLEKILVQNLDETKRLENPSEPEADKEEESEEEYLEDFAEE